MESIKYILLNIPYILTLFWNMFRFWKLGISYGSHLRVGGRLGLRIIDGKCKIGNNFLYTSGIFRNPIARNLSGYIFVNKGSLTIGDNVGCSSTCIWCEKEITIGNNCTIGANVIITDTDAHSIYANERIGHCTEYAKKAPIHIGNNVFIGVNSIILKGCIIGNNAVIGAGSVVTRNIPANELWAGNPAKFIKKIEER